MRIDLRAVVQPQYPAFYARHQRLQALDVQRQAHQVPLAPQSSASPRRLEAAGSPARCLIQPLGASDNHLRSAYAVRPAGVASFSTRTTRRRMGLQITGSRLLALPARRHIPVNAPLFQVVSGPARCSTPHRPAPSLRLRGERVKASIGGIGDDALQTSQLTIFMEYGDYANNTQRCCHGVAAVIL